MTKKDYALIADTLRKTRALNVEVTLDEMVSILADALFADNPAFRRDKFISACYYDNKGK